MLVIYPFAPAAGAHIDFDQSLAALRVAEPRAAATFCAGERSAAATLCALWAYLNPYTDAALGFGIRVLHQSPTAWFRGESARSLTNSASGVRRTDKGVCGWLLWLALARSGRKTQPERALNLLVTSQLQTFALVALEDFKL
jgi:hypothetical protein